MTSPSLRTICPLCIHNLLCYRIPLFRSFAQNVTRNPEFNVFFEPFRPTFPGDDCFLISMYLMHEKFYARTSSAIAAYLRSLSELDTAYFQHLPYYWSKSSQGADSWFTICWMTLRWLFSKIFVLLVQAILSTLPSGKTAFQQRMDTMTNAEKYVRGELFPLLGTRYNVRCFLLPSSHIRV